MKRFLIILFLMLFLCGCAPAEPPAQIAATTLPVYEFTARLCDGTGITVTRLITEEVSCLHDYSLNVRQVKAAESAELIVISGAGLEEFMEDLIHGRPAIDASTGIELLCPEEGDDHAHEHEHDGHHHESDPHIWLSPVHAASMARNICDGLTNAYPAHAETFARNLAALTADLLALDT